MSSTTVRVTPWRIEKPLQFYPSIWPPKRKHRFSHCHFNFSINLNLILDFHILSSYSAKMVRTRSQLDFNLQFNLSKEELIKELITVDDISWKLSGLSNRFDDFLRRFEVAPSDLAITRNCDRLLTETVVQLERNAVTNAQCHRRELVEVNPVPPLIIDEELELNIWKALPLTGHVVRPDDVQASHRLKKKESVIVNFNCRKLKRRVLVNRKHLRNKLKTKFSGNLFISESMCHENHHLAYKRCQLECRENRLYLVLE